MITSCKAIILRERPKGIPSTDTFRIVEVPVSVPQEGELLIKSRYISVDPYMRNRMNNVASYIAPYELDQIITGDLLGEVIESKTNGFKKGDYVTGILEWKEYNTVTPTDLTKVDVDRVPESAYLSTLGLTGLTAYFGLLDIGKPKTGETIVISGAAGAVGSIAGQIAKMNGCRVIGITGSDYKVQFLKEELEFDEVINYKEYSNLRKPVRKVCPDGVDIYFDNVGGEISDSIIQLLNDFSRVVLCGQISLYNLSRMDRGPRIGPQLLIHRTLMQGFNVFDYKNKYEKAKAEIANWLISGALQSPVNIIHGFENIPDAFLGLFRGDNIGKQLVKL